jgi:hypothetical protein
MMGGMDFRDRAGRRRNVFMRGERFFGQGWLLNVNRPYKNDAPSPVGSLRARRQCHAPTERPQIARI